MTLSECLFCNIISKQIPGEIVFENSELIAFLDIKPVNYGHVVIAPKKHTATMVDTSDHLLSDLGWLAKNIGMTLMETMGYEGFNVGINNGLAAGQEIMHFHCHVIPRKNDDGFYHWPRKEYNEGEMASTAEKIRAALK